MSDAGFHCFAPDWIGFGFSDKPQPGYGFDYTGFHSYMIITSSNSPTYKSINAIYVNFCREGVP